MDAHFHEYLAAIDGMHDIYGDCGDAHASEFHEAVAGPATESLPRRPTMQCSAGPAAIVVMTHISTQATNSRRSINSAS